MPCKNACAIIDTIYTRSVPSIQLVWNSTKRLLGAQGLFLESRPNLIFVWNLTPPCLIWSNLPINVVENIIIFAIRAAVSEIQLILTLNGNLALIGY